MFKRLRVDADLSQEQELRVMVAKSLSSLETFGKVSERSCWGTGSNFDFQRKISSSDIMIRKIIRVEINRLL